MKKFIIAYLLFFPVLVFAQEVPKEYRKMNTMVIDYSSPDIFKDLSNHLMDNGLEIDKVDYDLGIIETKPFPIGAAKWRLRARIKDGKIEFTHYSQLIITVYGVTNDSWSQENFKSGGLYTKMTGKLLSIVSSLNSEITYFER